MSEIKRVKAINAFGVMARQLPCVVGDGPDFPDESAVQFSAFVKSHAMGAAQVDGAVGFSAVLRLTGGVTLL